MFEIDKKYNRANISRTIRFTDTIFNELKEISDREDISFNNLVLQCCAYAISEYYDKAEETDL